MGRAVGGYLGLVVCLISKKKVDENRSAVVAVPKNSQLVNPPKRAEESPASARAGPGARPLTQLTPITGSDHRFPSPLNSN